MEQKEYLPEKRKRKSKEPKRLQDTKEDLASRHQPVSMQARKEEYHRRTQADIQNIYKKLHQINREIEEDCLCLEECELFLVNLQAQLAESIDALVSFLEDSKKTHLLF